MVKFQKVLIDNANGGSPSSHHNLWLGTLSLSRLLNCSIPIVVKDSFPITSHNSIMESIMRISQMQYQTTFLTSNSLTFPEFMRNSFIEFLYLANILEMVRYCWNADTHFYKGFVRLVFPDGDCTSSVWNVPKLGVLCESWAKDWYSDCVPIMIPWKYITVNLSFLHFFTCFLREDKLWLLHPENSPAHNSLGIWQALAKKYIVVACHPSYSSDLRFDYFLFPKLKGTSR